MNTNNPTGPTSSDGGGWFDDFAPLTDQSTPETVSGDHAGEESTDDAGTPSSASGDELEETDPLSAVSSSAPTISAPTPGEADTDTFPAIAPQVSGWEWIAPEQPVSTSNQEPGLWPGADESSAPHHIDPMPTDVFPLSAGGPPVRPPRRRRALRGYIIAGALLVLVIALAGAGAFVALSGDSTENRAVSDQSTPSAIAPPLTAAEQDADCPNRTDGPVTTGRDAGGTTSGPDAIKAFEYAYYVQRSGAKAREVVAPLARVPTAEEIQGGIDSQLAQGTGHCLKITDRTGGLWGVELTVVPPAGAEPEVLPLLISTAVIDGRTLITAITKDTTQ
ncbi:hypothetical protein [Rhodococcus sp. NPDC006774]|uniref:hypothetical protein n=1 Tax=Rhodococcus sp. NPDC006774 TaxID=3157186 RepID=UPI0033DAB703